MLVLHKQKPACSELCLLPLGEVWWVRKSCKPLEKADLIQCNNSKKGLDWTSSPHFRIEGLDTFVLILKLRAVSSSHWGPLKASQFFRPLFLPKMRSTTKGSAGSFAGFWGVFLFFCFLQWATSQKSISRQLSAGSMGSPAPGRSPGGFLGLPQVGSKA